MERLWRLEGSLTHQQLIDIIVALRLAARGDWASPLDKEQYESLAEYVLEIAQPHEWEQEL